MYCRTKLFLVDFQSFSCWYVQQKQVPQIIRQKRTPYLKKKTWSLTVFGRKYKYIATREVSSLTVSCHPRCITYHLRCIPSGVQVINSMVPITGEQEWIRALECCYSLLTEYWTSSLTNWNDFNNPSVNVCFFFSLTLFIKSPGNTQGLSCLSLHFFACQMFRCPLILPNTLWTNSQQEPGVNLKSFCLPLK